jgi:hypothetical protein
VKGLPGCVGRSDRRAQGDRPTPRSSDDTEARNVAGSGPDHRACRRGGEGGTTSRPRLELVPLLGSARPSRGEPPRGVHAGSRLVRDPRPARSLGGGHHPHRADAASRPAEDAPR